MRLLLIRHGQTVDNERGALSTASPGPGLNPLGREQAAAVPAAMLGEELDAIYTSTLLRTQETARPLAADRTLEPQVIDGIHEIEAGDLEGRTDAESVSAYIHTVFSWWVDMDARVPGGENGVEFFRRFDDAISRIAAQHDRGAVAVVSHGAAIRSWSARASVNIDSEFSRTHPLDNTGIVVMEGSPRDGWLTTHWQGEPVGGEALADADAPDPTGEAG